MSYPPCGHVVSCGPEVSRCAEGDVVLLVGTGQGLTIGERILFTLPQEMVIGVLEGVEPEERSGLVVPSKLVGAA